MISPRAQARLLDRPARTIVIGRRLLEEVQHVPCAVGRPHRQEAMIGVLQVPPRRTVTSLGSRILVKMI